MAVALTPAMVAAMRAKRPLAMLVEIDHPDGLVNVWSRGGTLNYDGKSWTGLGVLGRVTPVTSSTATVVQEVRFELHRVPPEATALLSDRVRNRQGRMWLAAIGAGRQVVAEPLLLIDAKLDVQEMQMGDDRMMTVAIVGQYGFVTLERAQRLAWTPEQQKLTYPTDVGLDGLPDLVEKDVNWRP